MPTDMPVSHDSEGFGLAVAGGVSSYWILTDQAQFAPPEVAAAAAAAANRLEVQP